MLMRMETRKEVKRQARDFSTPDLFMLPSTHRLKSTDKALHETGGADLFVAFGPYINGWSHEPQVGSDRADRAMIFEGKLIYFEVDRNTHGPKALEEKIDKYIRYADRTRERFYVVFSVLLDDDKKLKNRADFLAGLLASKRRGNQFLVANHNNLLVQPMGDFLLSPLSGALSFRALE